MLLREWDEGLYISMLAGILKEFGVFNITAAEFHHMMGLAYNAVAGEKVDRSQLSKGCCELLDSWQGQKARAISEGQGLRPNEQKFLGVVLAMRPLNCLNTTSHIRMLQALVPEIGGQYIAQHRKHLREHDSLLVMKLFPPVAEPSKKKKAVTSPSKKQKAPAAASPSKKQKTTAVAMVAAASKKTAPARSAMAASKKAGK